MMPMTSPTTDRPGNNLDHGMYLCGDNEIISNNIVAGNAANGLQVAGYRTVSQYEDL